MLRLFKIKFAKPKPSFPVAVVTTNVVRLQKHVNAASVAMKEPKHYVARAKTIHYK
jgi:hypothetical protein